jgi:hypothetical protein
MLVIGASLPDLKDWEARVLKIPFFLAKHLLLTPCGETPCGES